MIIDCAKFLSKTLQAIDDFCVMSAYPAQRRVEVLNNADNVDARLDVVEAEGSKASSGVTESPVVITPESRLEVYANHLYGGILSCMHLGIFFRTYTLNLSVLPVFGNKR
jgi:hypothetical protein